MTSDSWPNLVPPTPAIPDFPPFSRILPSRAVVLASTPAAPPASNAAKGAGFIRFFDEMQGQGGEVRAPYREFCDWLDGEDPARIHRKAQQAEAFFRTIGITFNVYGADGGDEGTSPSELVPRNIAAGGGRCLPPGRAQRR